MVDGVQREPKVKYKPYPMNTIELTKLATSKLKMQSHKVMEIAEKLYNKGYISYPRTETDKYSPSINLTDLVFNLTPNQQWGQYA